MKRLHIGTLLFRALDCAPDEVSDPKAVNKTEEVLWLAQDSMAAQTHIPVSGPSTSFSIPHGVQPGRGSPVCPDDGLVSGLVKQLGGELIVERREHPLPQGEHEIPAANVVNGTWGRPVAWSQPAGRQITWDDILAEMKRLGYGASEGWVVRLRLKQEGENTVLLPARDHLRGTLAVYQVVAPLEGVDATNRGGGPVDPDCHRAAQWAATAMAGGLGFVAINDFCQTEKWGSVGHTAYAMNRKGIESIALVSLLPARHREWGETLTESVTIEERSWRRGLLTSAPHPDLVPASIPRTIMEPLVEMVAHEKGSRGELAPGFKFHGPADFILKHGKEYAPAPLPPGIEKGRPGRCFQNAAKLVGERPDLTYVEGFACNLVPCLHAWCVDTKGCVIDPTWGHEPAERVRDFRYFGVEFNQGYVRQVQTEKQFCIIDTDEAPLLKDEVPESVWRKVIPETVLDRPAKPTLDPSLALLPRVS